MHVLTLMAFQEELGLIKSAGAAASLGAMGAGVSLLHGGLKEWDSRAAENRALSKVTPEHSEAAKQHVRASRIHRLKRMGVNAALAGGTGAVIGHYGSKAVGSLSSTASQALADKVKPALQEALAKGHAQGIQEGGKGAFWRMFQRPSK